MTIAKGRDIKEKCYRLHGFPADFKFTKERNAGTTTHVHGSGTGSELEENHQNQGQHFTMEQYNQLVQLLNNLK